MPKGISPKVHCMNNLSQASKSVLVHLAGQVPIKAKIKSQEKLPPSFFWKGPFLHDVLIAAAAGTCQEMQEVAQATMVIGGIGGQAGELGVCFIHSRDLRARLWKGFAHALSETRPPEAPPQFPRKGGR